MRRFIPILLSLLSFSLQAQNISIFPEIKGLRKIETPEKYSPAWSNLNGSIMKKYYVQTNGTVSIQKETYPHEILLKTDNGLLIGENKGEWGGHLIFKSDSGIIQKVLTSNICNLFSFQKNIYVLTGNTSFGSVGTLLKLQFNNTNYTVSEEYKLSGEPGPFFIYNNEIYIVTYDGIDIFNGNSIRNVLSNQFWGSLYPQTIVVNGSLIAIGARGCVIIIDKNKNVNVYQ